MNLLPPPSWMSTGHNGFIRWRDRWTIFRIDTLYPGYVLAWSATHESSKKPKRIKSYACHMEQPVDFNDACTREMMGRSWPSSSSDMRTRRWIT